ncbi:MAG: RHS repeat-associated core domain-containing protein [Rhodanobacteraceae bacterium]|nr:RHS repeat-associated core domain-containing protein [Rhodanobacteraceae bacterium]
MQQPTSKEQSVQAKFNIGAGEVAVCGEARDAAIVDFRTGSANNKIVSQYQYNARGERVRKYKGSTTQARYVYNEAGQLLVEQTISGSTTTTSEIVWLDNLPVGVIRNNILHYIEPDHLGTPRQVIDRTRDVAVWRWDLLNDPFGESAPNTNPDADGTQFDFNMRFPGQLFDAESGLNYNYFRDYEAATGRYVESDPVGLSAGMSTFGYSLQNPIVVFDPDGLKSWICGRPMRGLSLVQHTFVCTTNADGTTDCGGNAPSCPVLGAIVGCDGKDSQETYNPKQCRQIDDDKDRCFEECLKKEFKKKRPQYGIGPQGTDCREWADDVWSRCARKCNEPVPLTSWAN